MAGTGGRTHASLSDLFHQEAFRFDFFQAVRLVEALARERSQADTSVGQQAVGTEALPRQEAVRFRALPSLSFPPGDVSQVAPLDADPAYAEPHPGSEMTVAFLGLTGPNGVLPQHYTSLLIERCHVNNKDETLRDFFDLFNHRAISLFYRAWEKYHFTAAFERFRLNSDSGAKDLFTLCLYSLVGLGTAGLQHRQRTDDETILYYSGHFAHRPRTAVTLQQILSDHFRMAVEIQQFFGRWLYLPEDVQSSLPCDRWPEGLNSALGQNMIIGKRVWDNQSKFRLRLGPVNYQEFLQFTPTGAAFRSLCEMVRLYVGPELSFDVQVVLKAEDVPYCRLGTPGPGASCLGWNTWLKSQPAPDDAEDAVFRPSE